MILSFGFVLQDKVSAHSDRLPYSHRRALDGVATTPLLFIRIFWGPQLNFFGGWDGILILFFLHMASYKVSEPYNKCLKCPPSTQNSLVSHWLLIIGQMWVSWIAILRESCKQKINTCKHIWKLFGKPYNLSEVKVMS